MGLEISEVVADAMDVILLTFIIVWRERNNERSEGIGTPLFAYSDPAPQILSPVDE